MKEDSVLNKKQLEMIDLIDKKLSDLMKELDYDDYLKFLRSDEYLATYDDVLGYNDVNYLPKAFLAGLTEEFLEKVNKRVDLKLKEIN